MSKRKNQLKPIDKPVYRYWAAVYMSFYSRRLYVDVGKRWKGLGIIYLLLVITLFSLPFFYRMADSMNQSFQEQLIDPLLKIPVFYIQNGEISFDKPMPYFIKDKKDQVLVAIDTTGKVNNFSGEYPYMTVLINKDKISLRVPNLQLFNMKEQKNSAKPIVQQFDKSINMVFNAKKLVEDDSIYHLKYASEAMTYPLIIAIFFSLFIVFFMVIALLGQTFSSILFSFKISFNTAARLMIVSATPMILLLLVMLAANNLFPGLGIILLALLVIYYSFALYALRAESRQAVIS